MSLLRSAHAMYRRLPIPVSLRHRLSSIAAKTGFARMLGLSVMTHASAQDRKGWLLSHISPESQEGLEIGPLCSPLVTKAASNGRVRYVDFTTAEKLRDRYRSDPNVRIDEIVETDILWGRQSLPESTGGEQFDYVIASHVIEHVPNMLGWLQEVSAVLKDGGLLLLAIPDKRYTFDYKRDLTTLGMLVEAYLLDRRRPGVRDVFDMVSLAVEVDAAEAWVGKLDPGELRHYSTLEAALEYAKQHLLSEEYNDVHVNILTPARFRTLLEQAARLGLLDFSLVALRDTIHGSNEFLVSLRRLPRDGSRDENLALQLRSFGAVTSPGRIGSPD